MNEQLKTIGFVTVSETEDMQKVFLENKSKNKIGTIVNTFFILLEKVKNSEHYPDKYYLIWQKHMMEEIIQSSMRLVKK